MDRTRCSVSFGANDFTTEYLGKAWHQFEPLREADGREGLVGLLVDPATPAQCQVIHWSPEAIAAGLSGTAPVLNNAPLARVLSTPTSGSGRSTVGVRVWDVEAHAAAVELQFQRPGETNWNNARLLTVEGQTANAVGATTPLSTQPSGVSHTLVWNAALDLGSTFNNTVLLRTRGTDTTTGAWSDPMPYTVNVSVDLDTDGDGVTDEMELRFGTSITNPSSLPRITLITANNGAVTLAGHSWLAVPTVWRPA